MTTYIVTHTYRHTETFVIEADSKAEAEIKALDLDGESNNDDWLYSVETKERKGQS